MKNVRTAINRHLKDIGRQIDIVKDIEFKSSNTMLSSKLKFNLKQEQDQHNIILQFQMRIIFKSTHTCQMTTLWHLDSVFGIF